MPVREGETSGVSVGKIHIHPAFAAAGYALFKRKSLARGICNGDFYYIAPVADLVAAGVIDIKCSVLVKNQISGLQNI